MKKIFSTKVFVFTVMMALLFCVIDNTAVAAGLFGAPQTVSRPEGGLNTAIGYLYHEDIYENGAKRVVRQNEIYSQAAYGAKNIWEIYARVGISDFTIAGAFTSTDSATVTNKNDFREHWKFFGTLGAKAFYPVTKIFGAGVFVQGTYYFSDFKDDVSGTSGSIPFTTNLKVKNLWDVHCGVGFQITLPLEIRLYGGPYIYYSEAKMSLASDISGLEYAAGNVSVKNKSIAGGFAGVDIPLTKGFRLNIEGQYSERFSAGAAISYTY